jgi:hypothetical protein
MEIFKAGRRWMAREIMNYELRILNWVEGEVIRSDEH